MGAAQNLTTSQTSSPLCSDWDGLCILCHTEPCVLCCGCVHPGAILSHRKDKLEIYAPSQLLAALTHSDY